MTNPIRKIHLSHIKQPLSLGFADAKVATGKQSALTAVDLLFVEIEADTEHTGLGFAYTLRAGGTAFLALAEELAPMLIGEDAQQIEALWQKLAWRTNSLGVGGLAYQVIAAFDSALWDLKAKQAGLPLAKLWGTQVQPGWNTLTGLSHSSTNAWRLETVAYGSPSFQGSAYH